MSTVDRALALLTGDEPQHTQTPSARTIEKAVAWEIEDEIAAKTGRARFGPLQALAGDLDALEESIKEVDAWLAKNVDDLDGGDAAVRDVSDDTKTNEVVTENLEALDRVLAKVVATAPQGLSLHARGTWRHIIAARRVPGPRSKQPINQFDAVDPSSPTERVFSRFCSERSANLYRHLTS